MGAKNFYDVVLVGLDLANLVAGALLAKRGFRVLLIGQGRPWPSYDLASVRFPRAPFSMPGPDSPALARVFGELALRPLVQRRARRLSPALQAVMPRHRVDLSRDVEALGGELGREFPEARLAFDELLARARLESARLDRLVERDLTWPPLGFFERREFARASVHTPFAEEVAAVPSGLEPGQPLTRIVDACLAFDGEGPLGPTPTARALRLLHARLGAAALEEGGLTGLYELLIENIRTHNGSLRLSERVDRLSVRRGTLERLHLLPSDEEIGCHFLIWGLPIVELGRLLDDKSPLDALYAEYGEPRARAQRFTLNLLLRSEAIPEGLSRDVLVLGSEPLWGEVQRLSGGEHAILTVEALIDAQRLQDDPTWLSGQRARMQKGLRLLSPFFERHLVLVDSPHDGLAPEGDPTIVAASTDLLHRRGPETMERVYTYPLTRIHGSCALPVRTGVKRLLVCNPQVVPGLGFEGLFLAASSAARTVTRALNRDWMNRGRWTKVEL